jgi:hypothetical protein
MPGEQNNEQNNEQNRKRGRDEAFSKPNVELAGLNKPAGQPGTSEATLSKVGQVLANYGLTLPQAATNAATREVIPVGETDNQRQDRRAGIAQAQAPSRGRASTANAGGAQLGGDGQPGVGRGANPGQ